MEIAARELARKSAYQQQEREAAKLAKKQKFLKYLDLQAASITANNRYDPFHVAAKHGQLEILKELLCSFHNLVISTDATNSTALHTAAAQVHIDVVNLLLDAGSNLAKIARNNGKTYWNPSHCSKTAQADCQ